MSKSDRFYIYLKTVKVCLIISVTCVLLSCDSKSTKPPDDDPPDAYSFFVAGHVYGSPGVDNEGVHPPFKNNFDIIQNDTLIEFGAFTGDIVISSTDQNWDEIDADIDLLGIPIHFAAGNHDLSNRTLFEQRYGETYFCFIHNDDLFIILDPNIDDWNISGSQLEFLQNQLGNINDIENIFILFHQTLWWEDDNLFSGILPNSTYGRADSINFWSEVEPLLHNIDHDVYMFAGDMGAFASRYSFMYYHYDNIHFIGSGMGGNVRDNFIIVDIKEDKSVEFRLIAINGDDINALGNLEDFILPTSNPGQTVQIDDPKAYLEDGILFQNSDY